MTTQANTNTTMPVIATGDNLRDLLMHCIALDTPIMLWGSPGIGKTSVVEQVATATCSSFVPFLLSQYDSVDLRGLPDVDPATGLTRWCAPSTLPVVGNPAFDTPAGRKKPIILFLDEMMQANPAVQAVAFQLVLERRVGEHRLMPNVRIVAASNRETDKAGAGRMLTPLANRFAHIEVAASLDGWVAWARKDGLPEPLVAYLRFRPDNLDQFEQAQKASLKAFATPRSWARVGTIQTAMADKLDSPVFQTLVQATIGPAIAAEYLAFLRTWTTMPDIDGVLAAPDTAATPTDPAMRFAVTSALAQRVVALKGTKRNAALTALQTYLARMPSEYAVKTMLDCVQRDADIASEPAMTEFIGAHSDLLLGV